VPAANILSPREGDVLPVGKVRVLSTFADCNNTLLKCYVGQKFDAEFSANQSGGHDGETTEAVLAGTHTVEVRNGKIVFAQEPGVIVQANPPIIIGGGIGTANVDKRKIHKISVTVDQANANYVVVQVFELDQKTGHVILKAAGAANVKQKEEVKVDLDTDFKAEDRYIYFARAYAYNREMQLRASTSLPLKKP